MVGIAGPPIAAALAFSLAATACFSLALSWSESRKSGLTINTNRVRSFKEDDTSIPIRIHTASSQWLTISNVEFNSIDGLTGRVSRTGADSTELIITPKLAGRIEGLTAVFEEVDVLGLFAFRKEVILGLVVESLPVALKVPATPIRVSPQSVGENPAGIMGSGQELYAMTEYQFGVDTRDILWKRAARMSDDRIPARVREANVRKVITIGIAVRWKSRGERAARADLIAEALAQVCMDFLLIGTSIEVDYPTGGRVQSIRISNLAELADAVVGPWITAEADGDPNAFERAIDILVVGPEYLPNSLDRHTRMSRLLVVGSPDPDESLKGAVGFTGKEDLTELASEVASR
jgi:uncharacterized protein (DUF58 family)